MCVLMMLINKQFDVTQVCASYCHHIDTLTVKHCCRTGGKSFDPCHTNCYQPSLKCHSK
jgi:hypothetical protein